MKKFVCVILALALALIAGCSSGETSAPDNSPAAAVPSPVETYDLPEASPPVPVPFSRLDTPEPTASPVSAQAEPATESGEAVQTSGGIDIDLTQVSGGVVYGEVFNMTMYPEDYVGKTVKMHGVFGIGYSYKPDGSMDESTLRFACIILDATACCTQDIEFVWSGEHSYPDDYPELGGELTVTGRYETYERDGLTYCHLVDAELSY